jgi:hypothetical protein
MHRQIVVVSEISWPVRETMKSMNSLAAFGCGAPLVMPAACMVSLTGLSGTHCTGAPCAALIAACVLFISSPIAYSPPMTRSSTARMAIGSGTMSCLESARR